MPTSAQNNIHTNVDESIIKQQCVQTHTHTHPSTVVFQQVTSTVLKWYFSPYCNIPGRAPPPFEWLTSGRSQTGVVSMIPSPVLTVNLLRSAGSRFWRQTVQTFPEIYLQKCVINSFMRIKHIADCPEIHQTLDASSLS